MDGCSGPWPDLYSGAVVRGTGRLRSSPVPRPRFRHSREATPREDLRQGAGPWRLVVAWVILILLATTVPFPAGLVETGPFPVDKVVHFAMYAGLGWTVARALAAGERLRASVLAVAWCLGLLFAVGDELHQHLIPGRDPAVGDWAADAVGFTVAFLASSVRARARARARAEIGGEGDGESGSAGSESARAGEGHDRGG